MIETECIDVSRLIAYLEKRIRQEVPDIEVEFQRHDDGNYIQLWMYVTNKDDYDRINAKSREIAEAEKLDLLTVDIWFMAKVRPMESESVKQERAEREMEEILRRREEFLERHPDFRKKLRNVG